MNTYVLNEKEKEYLNEIAENTLNFLENQIITYFCDDEEQHKKFDISCVILIKKVLNHFRENGLKEPIFEKSENHDLKYLKELISNYGEKQ